MRCLCNTKCEGCLGSTDRMLSNLTHISTAIAACAAHKINQLVALNASRSAFLAEVGPWGSFHKEHVTLHGLNFHDNQCFGHYYMSCHIWFHSPMGDTGYIAIQLYFFYILHVYITFKINLQQFIFPL